MQDIMPQVGAGAQLIQSYGADGFRIGNAMYDSHVIVTPNHTYVWSGELTLDAFAPVFTTLPLAEVLLIGTGARHVMVPPALRAQLKARELATDTMDTGAACRTFNILLGEGRRVAAAILLPKS